MTSAPDLDNPASLPNAAFLVLFRSVMRLVLAFLERHATTPETFAKLAQVRAALAELESLQPHHAEDEPGTATPQPRHPSTRRPNTPRPSCAPRARTPFQRPHPIAASRPNPRPAYHLLH